MKYSILPYLPSNAVFGTRPCANNLPTFLYSVWVTCKIGDHHFFGHPPESSVFPVRSAAEEATA